MANDEGKGKKAEELASAMKEAKSASADVTRSFQQQLDIIKQMRDAMNEVTKSMRMMCEQDCGGMSSDKWEEVTKAVDKTGNSTNNTTESVKKMADVMQSKWTKAALVSAAALDGLVQGFKNFIALSKGAFGVFSGLVGGLGSVAASIIAIPFKLISGLFSMAQKGGGGNELAAAYEEVRKEFGSFKSDSAKAIIDTAVNMDKMNQTGVSAYRIFGNAAERLKAVKEMAVGMGSAFQVFGPEVEKNGTAIMMYNKGLGITNEQLSSIASSAMRMGKGIADVQLDMTKQALGMSKAFGVNAKVISKDMAKAMQDLSHFGHLSTKELAVAATFANKLGVSVDKLTGIMDATATFDQAAEGMSKLNEQFGTNIDATAIMSAQNPAEKMEILRKEFAKTGKDMSQMTYQERMLIKQSSGLSDEMLNAAFSAKNAGVSLDKIASQGGKNEKKTMTQADAMHKLADSIERLTPSGGGAGGGLLNHLFQGFLRGIQSSPEFIKLMMNIRTILIDATMYGVKLGKMFVDLFPGVKDVFKGLGDVFDPKKFRKLFDGIIRAFDVFKAGGARSLEEFMEKIDKTFTDFFNSEKPAGKKVLEGFKKFGLAVVAIFGKMSEWVIPKLADMITSIANWIRNPNIPDVTGVASGASSALLVPLAKAFELLKDQLLPALKDLASALFVKLKDAILNTSTGKGAIAGAISIILGPMLGKGLLSLITSKFITKSGESVGSSIVKSIASSIISSGTKSLGSAVSKVSEAGEKFVKSGGDKAAGGVSEAGAANKAAGEAIDKGGKGDKWGVQDAAKLGLKLIAIATAISVGGIMLAGAVLAMSKILAGEDITPSLKVLAAMALATIPVALSMKLLSKAGDPASLAIGGLVLVAVTGIVGAVGALITMLFSTIKDKSALESAGNMMLKMSLVFLAMIPVVAAATAIGAVAAASGGLSVLAAAAGLAIIGEAVTKMAETSQGIIEKVSSLKIGAGFQQKIDAFLGIMNAIQSFTSTLVRVIELTQPSLMDLMPGAPKEKFSEKIEYARKFVNDMIGDSSKGLIGMIETIMGIIRQLSVGPSKLLASAQMFAAVMEAISSSIKALTPSDAFYEAGGGFLARLTGGSFSDVAGGVANYAKGMGDALIQMLTGGGGGGILGLINKIVNDIKLPKGGIEQAREIVNIITSIANITKALTPDPKTIELMQDSGFNASYAWGLIKFDNKKKGITPEDIKKTMEDKVTNIKGIIDAITKGPLRTILATEIPKEKLEGMKVIGDIMKIVADLASAIASATPKGNVTIGSGAAAIVNLVPNVSQFLEGIKSNIGGLVTSLTDAVKSVPADKEFASKLEKAKTMFSFLGEIPKMTESMGGSPGTLINTDPWVNAIAATSMFLWRIMFGGGAFGTSGSPLTELVSHLNYLNTKVMPSVDVNVTKASFEKLKTILFGVNQTTSDFADMSANVGKAAQSISKEGTSNVLTAISKMVNATNAINDQLSTLPVLNVNTKLKTVANGLGLGSKAEYTVKNKDVVISIDLNVTMEADKVEQVIISRHNSIIRDRINYAIEKGGRGDEQAPSAKIKSTGPQTGFPGKQFGT